MKKTIMTLMALSVFAVGSAIAADLSVEGRFGNVGSSTGTNSSEFDVAIKAPIASVGTLGAITLGGELQAKEYAGSSSVTSVSAANVGTSVSWNGFKLSPFVEVGRFAVADASTNFFGAGATVSHAVQGPVSVEVGYRHRGGTSSALLMNEDRLSAAAVLSVGTHGALAATFYHNTGTLPENQVGVGYRYSF
jgi:hypothetical protein